MEIYLRLGCLGGNIGGFYHFGLGDGSGTPSLGINLMGKLNIKKLLEEKHKPTKSFYLSSLSRSRKTKGRKENTENRGNKLEFLRLVVRIWRFSSGVNQELKQGLR